MATELAKAYVQIIPSTKGMKENLTSALSGDVDKAGTASGTALGTKMMAAFKGAAVAAGISKFLKDTLSAGGAIQQSFGGLDTLYGKASEAAKNYAWEAAQAGISANEYAEQAVSFGASLKQAFSGDTQKAMEAANTAILDMADNAAKMGTPLESIQNAYQGFAKQNYTMLDNLKLGYGGTKQEMERLLKDAQKLTGIRYNINNLGDVYAAIHAIQGELGITGVAAQEASETLTGSIGAVKASWQNLLASLSTGNDIKKPIEVLVNNLVGFISNNLIPMLVEVIKNIPTLIIATLLEVSDALREMIENLADSMGSGLMDKLTEFIPQLLDYITQNLPIIFENIGSLINAAIQALPEILIGILYIIGEVVMQLPALIGSLLMSLFTFINGLLGGFFTEIGNKIEKFMENPLYYLGELAGKLLAKIIQMNVDITNKIVEFFTVTIPAAWEKFKTWLAEKPEQIKQFFLDLPDKLKEIGKNMIEGLMNGIKEKWESLKSSIKSMAKGVVDGFKNSFQIRSPSRIFRDQIGKQLTEGMAIGIRDNIDSVTGAMKELKDKTISSMDGATIGINAIDRISVANTYSNIATRNNSNGSQDSGVFALLSEYLPQLANMQMVTDTGAMVGALAPKMDSELGKRASMRGRFV